MSSVCRPGHTADTTPDHLTTVAPTPAAQRTTKVDPIATMGDPTVTIVGRTEMIGRIETAGHIEAADHIETIGHTATTGRTVTIVGATGMMILTTASGADLVVVPDITAIAGIMTPWWIMRAASLRFSCLIAVEGAMTASGT